MRYWGLLFLVLFAGMATGCGRRARVELPNVPSLNLAIPVECASEITLLECDARVSPPKCKKARVKYRKGCERIVVGKGNRKEG